MGDTIFDKILAGSIPADVVYEDDSVLAFHDVAPQAPVHVLVIPKHRMESLDDTPEAPDAVVAAFLKNVAHVARCLDLLETGYRVVFNTGADAQQSVQYLHAHSLAGRPLGWPPG